MEKKILRNPSPLPRSQVGVGAEEDAAARREFIKALRAAKELLSTTATGTGTATSATATTTVTVTATSTDQENGEHRTIEEQVDQPALPGPVDAPEDASKENVSPTKDSDEVDEKMGTDKR